MKIGKSDSNHKFNRPAMLSMLFAAILVHGVIPGDIKLTEYPQLG